jgi:hypothetical protein
MMTHLHLSYDIAGNDKKSVANIRRKYLSHEEQKQVIICRVFAKMRRYVVVATVRVA